MQAGWWIPLLPVVLGQAGELALMGDEYSQRNMYYAVTISLLYIL